MPPRRPAGYVTISSPDAPLKEADTLQCVHCGMHYQVVPFSGKVRGFCRNCMGPTCGQPKCGECMNFQKKLDLYERGKILSL